MTVKLNYLFEVNSSIKVEPIRTKTAIGGSLQAHDAETDA